MKPILSIIIISYNTADITIDCLRSIRQDPGLKDIPYELILIDNASPDDSVAKIKKLKIPNLIIEANQQNSGFAKANNQAFKIASGNFILLLNSDTIIKYGAISQTINWLSSHPESAVCTAQLLNSDGTIQPSGGFFPNLANIITWSLGLDDLPLVNLLIKPFHPHSPDFYTHDSFYINNHTQDWVTGAYLLTRRNIIDATNGFDETYFMYGEEVEWCYRIKKTFPKLTINYLVGAQVIHLGGASTTVKNSIYDKSNQGILQFFKKHKPIWQHHLVEQILKINVLLRNTVYKKIKTHDYVAKTN